MAYVQEILDQTLSSFSHFELKRKVFLQITPPLYYFKIPIFLKFL